MAAAGQQAGGTAAKMALTPALIVLSASQALLTPLKPIVGFVGGLAGKTMVGLVSLFEGGRDFLRSQDPNSLLASPVDIASVMSADRLKQSELEALAAKMDERIVSAARHLNDAHEHLNLLESATIDGSVPSKSQIAVEDTAAARRARQLSADNLEIYYEYAHDLEKAMEYLNLVAILECSLLMAIAELEQIDHDNFNGLEAYFRGAS